MDTNRSNKLKKRDAKHENKVSKMEVKNVGCGVGSNPPSIAIATLVHMRSILNGRLIHLPYGSGELEGYKLRAVNCEADSKQV